MRPALRLLLTIGVVVLLTPYAAPQGDKKSDRIPYSSGFMKGSDYLQLGETQRAAYAADFFNGLSVAPLLVKQYYEAVDQLYTCTEGMSARQLAEIIRRRIQDHPTEWHHELNMLGLDAMLNACEPGK
jgi:hypothetical protein